ncbi:GNAT family N-acetyltransferase [Thalassomonas viridans]|uniref:GNAT family N-acetyltransferase n=1 Tax=Thalassomonas viridans TaxID=137584 RepID=A0AAE9Z8G1_9GAMM|nr:GNAT family N-acetyltransferase [Thalassomonas viridans]WDE08681.1 GNAT family N-acetyltransferase [Thalassomonas viridans]
MTNTDAAILPMSVNHWTAFKRVQLHDWQKKYVPSPETLIRQSVFERRADHQFLLYSVFYQQHLVGGFSLSVTPDNELWLGGLQIDKQYQSKGLAAYVFTKVIEYICSYPKFVGLGLDVHSSNLAAYEFYQRKGLRVYGVFEHKGEELWLMKSKREDWL